MAENYCVMQLDNKCKDSKGVMSIDKFYNATNLTLFKNGKMPICKNCFKKYVYVDGEVDITKLKKILMICDIPYYEQEFKSALKSKNETIGTYMKNIQLNYKNSSWENGDAGNKEKICRIEDGKPIESDFEVTKEIIDFWGNNYSTEDYKFLQSYYHDLIRIYDHSLPVQINNYKNMAKTQLQANKCLATSDMGGYDKAMKILSMLSGDSNIKPVQESSTDRTQKGGYETFIKHIEDDEPIFDWEKDLGHRDTIKNLLNLYFFSHLAKVLGIKNPFADEYDEEMESYTVSQEEAEEDMANQIDFLDGDE